MNAAAAVTGGSLSGRRSVGSPPTARISTEFSSSDKARIEALISAARKQLRPFAEAEAPPPCPRSRTHALHDSLGAQGGVGALLRIASFGGSGNGHEFDCDAVKLGDGDAEAFLYESAAFIEGLQGESLNYSVIFSLFLTIFAALAAMTDPYADSDSRGAWLRARYLLLRAWSGRPSGRRVGTGLG